MRGIGLITNKTLLKKRPKKGRSPSISSDEEINFDDRAGKLLNQIGKYGK